MTEKQQQALAMLTVRSHLLWDNVRPSSGCWPWVGSVNGDGYGSVRVGPTSVLSHRAAYFLANGELPSGQCVCHQCDNPSCCNPAHLFLGDHAGNMRDMKEKGRRKGIGRGESNGRAKLTPDAVKSIRTSRAVGVQLKELALAYGVGISTIGRVCRGEIWS